MTLVRTIEEVRAAISVRHHRGAVGFVPTMGVLHEGHVSLCRLARAESECVVVSLFVNPLQFDQAADLAAYPRQELADATLADAEGVDVLFAPRLGEMYPAGFATTVDLAGPALGFEGAHRPGHFRGVATVCLRLFSIVRPHRVYLGQKDAQQVAVLRRLVADLELGIEIRVAPTVRDEDGLARSSRNARLSPADRRQAQAIPRALVAGWAAHRRGDDPAAAARLALADLVIDYVDVATFDGHPTLVIAVTAGHVRLIDNIPLDNPSLAGLSLVGDARPVADATGRDGTRRV